MRGLTYFILFTVSVTRRPFAPLREQALVVARNKAVLGRTRVLTQRGAENTIDQFVIVFAHARYIAVRDPVTTGTTLIENSFMSDSLSDNSLHFWLRYSREVDSATKD